MVTTLYIVRHGQSEGNKKKFFQGTMDIDLSELGHTHIKRASEYFKNIKIDKIYSSNLKRAYKTSKAILDANTTNPKQEDVIRLDDLNEIYAGDIQGIEYEQIAIRYPETHKALFNNPSAFAPPNGESMSDLYHRISKCIKSLIAENEGKTILLTSHGCSIKTMLCYIYGYDLKDMVKAPWVEHGNAVKVIFEDGKLKELSVIDVQNDVENEKMRKFL